MATTNSSINDRIRLAILESPHVKPSQLHFVTSRDRVTLSGTVETFFEKQMAQEALRHVDGLNEIENQLDVCWS